MNHWYLERHDNKDNLHRFYQIFVAPGLFDEWSVIKEWGRVGSPGTVRKAWYDTQAEAIAAGHRLGAAKMKKGYRTRR